MELEWAYSAGVAVAGAALLTLIYRRVQSKWPQRSMSLADYSAYVKSNIPGYYVLFSLGPVVLVGVLGADSKAVLLHPRTVDQADVE